MEGLLKVEKEKGSGLDVGVVWRRSFVDEAKGDKWEVLLAFLGVLAVRTLVEGMRESLAGEWELGIFKEWS